jgi:hypothetical protein
MAVSGQARTYGRAGYVHGSDDHGKRNAVVGTPAPATSWTSQSAVHQHDGVPAVAKVLSSLGGARAEEATAIRTEDAPGLHRSEQESRVLHLRIVMRWIGWRLPYRSRHRVCVVNASPPHHPTSHSALAGYRSHQHPAAKPRGRIRSSRSGSLEPALLTDGNFSHAQSVYGTFTVVWRDASTRGWGLAWRKRFLFFQLKGCLW